MFMRLHFYAGIFVGPFLLIAAVTGGLYAIAPSIEQFVYHDYLHTDSVGELRPVADQIRAAQARRPDLTVTAVRPATEPTDTTRVFFDDPTLGISERLAVFIDPVTATPQGELTVYGSSGALPVRAWISQLHRSLHLGDPGRLYSELAASWLWLITLAGLFLWGTRYRRLSARGDANAKLLAVDRSSRGRNRTLNWHGAVGIWIAAGLLFLSATGLTWSLYAGTNITDLRAALSWTTPTVSSALENTGATAAVASDHAGHEPGAAKAANTHTEPRVDDVDRVLHSARAAGIGGKVEVSIPAEAGTAFTVTQTRQPWVMSNNAVAVDGTTGTITDTSWFADWPLAAKLSAWGIQLHMGLLFGLVNQLVFLGLAAALVTVIVHGYMLWWRRRPARGGTPAGRPPRRGALTHLPLGAAVAVVAAAAAIGWFLPLFGLSLLAFVVVDILVGMLQGRRASAAKSR
ncbi:hypothetical protein MELE44368_18650 [Mycolicibacterium elephantis DSM 44368]|uniref:Peptidase n=1 Tax=Mycolicibacterium elephantis DSM 44368 TaxID=1335622 RepID=A0A439DUP0_9MYCO|nr:hypothetical protein MELE44368_18650 [Mycolicibacterium elephantis DSM 44368]